MTEPKVTVETKRLHATWSWDVPKQPKEYADWLRNQAALYEKAAVQLRDIADYIEENAIEEIISI